MLDHHIYELKKGVRDLILCTLPRNKQLEAIARLDRHDIPYLVREVNEKKVNVFFGDERCIDIIESFGDRPLNELSHEEDFMLGIMLGYSKTQQYDRYMERRQSRCLAAS